MFMSERRYSARLRSVLIVVAIAGAACKSGSNSPAYTQAGGAADLEKGAQSGASSASCKDLPPSADLSKWLRDAPGTGGEAGGLFSGRRMWASIVNRQGEI